jgi:hypothetical protein
MPDIEYNDRNDYVKHITYNCWINKMKIWRKRKWIIFQKL